MDDTCAVRPTSAKGEVMISDPPFTETQLLTALRIQLERIADDLDREARAQEGYCGYVLRRLAKQYRDEAEKE